MAERIEEAKRIPETHPKPVGHAVSDNTLRIERLEMMLITLTKEMLSVKGVIGNLAMKILDHDKPAQDIPEEAYKRANQIERDAKLLVAVLVADFKEGKTTGIPIEAGVLTESLGFKRPTDVYLDVQKKGL